LKDGVHVKDMIKIIQNHGLYNPTKLIISSDFSHIGTIVDLIETYTFAVIPKQSKEGT
jgi:hypothetical protein